MSVSSIYNSLYSVSDLAQLLGNQASQTSGTSSSASTGGLSSGGDTASISQAGQLLSQLQDLQTSDPTKFTQLMTQEASKLQAAATQAGINTPQGQILSSMAQKFQSVANGGSLSQLAPVAHHDHHHHHISAGASSAQGTYNQNGQTSTATSAGSASSSVQQILQGIFSDLQQAVQS